MSENNKTVNYGLTFAFNAFRLLLAVTTFISGLKASEMLGIDLPMWGKVLVALLLVMGIDMSLDYVLKKLLSMDGIKNAADALDADNAPMLWYGAAIVFLFATGGTTFFSGIIIGESSAEYVSNDTEQEQKEQARKNKVSDIAGLRQLIKQDSILLAQKTKEKETAVNAAIYSTSSTWNIETYTSGAYGNYSRKKSPAFFRYVDNINRIDSTHSAILSPIAERIAENRASLAGVINRNTDSLVSERIKLHNDREADSAAKLAQFVWLIDVFSVFAVVVLFFLLKSQRRRDDVYFDIAAHSFVQWLMDRTAETNNILLSALSGLIKSIANLLAAIVTRLSHILENASDMILGKKKDPQVLSFYAGGAHGQPQTPPHVYTETATQPETIVRTTFQARTDEATQVEETPSEAPKTSQNTDLSQIVKGFSDLQAFLATQKQTTQPETLVYTEHTDFDLLENDNETEFLHKGMSGIQALNKGTVKSKFNTYFDRCIETASRILASRILKETDEITGTQQETKQLRTMQNRVSGKGNSLKYWREAYKSVWDVDLMPERIKEKKVKPELISILNEFIK